MTEEKTAVVIGGSSGIGKAIAQTLVKEKFSVFVGDKKKYDDPPEGLAFKFCDISSQEQVDEFGGEFYSGSISPNVLVLAAGIGIHEKISEGDPRKWEAVMQVNIMGNLRVIRSLIPLMQNAGSGHIIFINSVSAYSNYEYGGIYCASRSALHSIAETLRLECKSTLRVTSVYPGVTDTDFYKNMISGGHSVESIGWGALQPEDVANAVLYAIKQPTHVAVNQIILRPPNQTL